MVVLAVSSLWQVIQRVSFVDIEAVKEEIPMHLIPTKYGGPPASVEPKHTRAWVEKRLAHFPTTPAAGDGTS